jgi:uroporphyrinogen-III synthase
MRLLVTRPEPDASATAAALRRRGHEAIVSPLLDIVPATEAHLPAGPFRAVVATSSNGVRALAGRNLPADLLRLPFFAVGTQTAAAAREFGFTEIVSAEGDMAALAALVAAHLPAGNVPLLYPAGETRAGDLTGALAARGYAVVTAELYRAVPRPRLTSEAEAAVAAGRLDGILLYSQRSAAALVAAIAARGGWPPNASHLVLFCISERTAEALRGRVPPAIAVADRPDEASLLSLVDAHAGKHGPGP